MDMYPKYISPLGYQMGDNRIDSYGVNHSGFNTQDSLYYNLARNKRENALIDQYKAQGITKNFPQYGTNFWGVPANNNYGFGNSDIVGTVEPMLSNPLANPPLNQNQTVQYAQNNLPQIANDVSHNPNYISDNDLYQKMWNNIKKFEKNLPYPYIDTMGNITTGAGANIDNYDDFMRVNFMVNGIPATDAQKLAAYNYLRQLSAEKDISGNYVNRNKMASFFENKTNLRISDQDAYNMAQNHMTNDLAHVRKEFTDFDQFPNPLKEVLLDIHYNTGGLNKQNWPKLYEAITNRDIAGIVNNVHRTNVGWERNSWAEKMARSIRF